MRLDMVTSDRKSYWHRSSEMDNRTMYFFKLDMGDSGVRSKSTCSHNKFNILCRVHSKDFVDSTIGHLLNVKINFIIRVCRRANRVNWCAGDFHME